MTKKPAKKGAETKAPRKKKGGGKVWVILLVLLLLGGGGSAAFLLLQGGSGGGGLSGPVAEALRGSEVRLDVETNKPVAQAELRSGETVVQSLPEAAGQDRLAVRFTPSESGSRPAKPCSGS